MTEKQLQILDQIESHPDCKGRTITTMITALRAGVKLDDVNTLHQLVLDAYKVQGVKWRKPSYVKKNFRNTYGFLVRELGE